MSWRILSFSSRRASENLAIDEAIARCGTDTVRFYARSHPTVALGYSKPFVNAKGVDIVRRIAGGGTTYHGKNDLTYSLVSAKIKSYEWACKGLIFGLRKLGICAKFGGPNDVLVDGKKISGCAQAKMFGTVIHQGTLIMGNPDREKMKSLLESSKPDELTSVEEVLGKKTGTAVVLDAMKKGFEEALGPLVEGKLTDGEIRLSKILESNRYSFDGWTKSRERKTVGFYAPGSPDRFPSVSVTGEECAVKCRHCEGRLLKTMVPVGSPEELLGFCRKLKAGGGEGCLISGGCTPAGRVPLENFIGVIAKAKKMGLKVVVHTGFVDPNLARKLKKSGIDSALIDVLGSDETVRKVVGGGFSVGRYERSMMALKEAGVPTVPHILVGLHFGKLNGEFDALRIVAKYGPKALVVIASQKIGGWGFEPAPEDIAVVIREAKKLAVPVALGCMRPKGEARARIDLLALQEGVDAIAHPHKKTIELVENLGIFELKRLNTCCAEVFSA